VSQASDHTLRRFLNKLIPRSFVAWTFVAIGAGLVCGVIFGPRCAVLNPLGDVFVRAYALVLLPYLIFEIIGIFGGLRRESLVALVKN
jgi:Na+/H+-dicarboxylate symporter